MEIVFALIVLGVLAYFAVGELFGKWSHKTDERIRQQMDELHRQEQMDKIEQAIMEGKDKVNLEGYRNETGNKRNAPLDDFERAKELRDILGSSLTMNSAREKIKFSYSDPKKWIKKDNVKTNAFNNQFIIQRNDGSDGMQCVACGSTTVTLRWTTRNEQKVLQYQCRTCGNEHTIESNGGQ